MTRFWVLVIGSGLILCLAKIGHSQTSMKYRPAVFAGVDFRASYVGTATVDIFQTSKFSQLGLVEAWNPLAMVALNTGKPWVFKVSGVATILITDTLIDKAHPRDRTWLYAAAWLIETLAVMHNRKLSFGLRGTFPIVLPALRWSLPQKSPNVHFSL